MEFTVLNVLFTRVKHNNKLLKGHNRAIDYVYRGKKVSNTNCLNNYNLCKDN
jgi:hypothetical protein